MSEARPKKETRLILVSAAVLLLGQGSAVAIYLAADDAPDGEQGYEVAGKFIYPAMQERSKRYQHDLEMYGGKAAVLADDINRWFDGLWRGRTLAFTVAVLSALAASGIFLVARYAHSDQDPESEHEEDRT